MANLTKLIITIILISLISTQFFNVNDRQEELSVSTSAIESPAGRTARTDTWNMFSHDLQHTSNTTTTAPLTNNILWTNTTGTASDSYSSPIIGYGKVFVGSGSSYLYCFDENTGEKLWANYYQKVSWGQCGSATLVNGKVFVGAEDSYVYCLDPTDGSEVWKYKTNNAVWSCPAVVNNRVYIGSADRYLYCIDETSGNLVWKYETNHSTYGYQDYGISSSPAVANGKVFIAACDGNLTCLPVNDPNSDGIINTSEKYWEFDTGCYVYASPTVYNGKVYIGTGSYSKQAGAPPIYKLYCVDENSGTKLWEFTAGSYFLGTPAIGYDKLYIGSLDGRLYCLPLEDPNANGVISASEIIWQFNTGNEVWGSAALAEERVYFASGIPYWESGNGDYRVYCLPINDPNDNGIITSDEIIWDYPIGAGVLCTPALLDGRLYVCDYDGKVYCFGKDTTPPRVKSVLPQEDATDASISTDIYVEFNENIAASSLTQSNFSVESEDSTLVSGVITYDDILFTAKFDPDIDLDEATTYTATLTNDIQDSNGNKLDCNGNGIIDPGEQYSWSFTTAKYPPEISSIPVQRPVEGEDWYLNMSLYVSDPNTPFTELIFTENSSYAVVQAELIVFNYPNGITNEQVNVSVTDGLSTVWQLVKVEVKQTNDPPVIASIPDIHAVEDIDKVVDISTYVSDIDNELEELTVSDNSLYATVCGMVLTFNYPNGILSEIVNITVHDGNKQSHREVNVIITPVNDAPFISEIPDKNGEEDIDLVVNITKYISDIDNTIDELTTYTDSDHASVESNANSIELTFNYPEGILFEEVTVTVSDSDKDASRVVNITIEPVNDPPTIGVIPVQYAVEDIDYELDLSEYVDDVDTPLSDLEASAGTKYLSDEDGLKLIFNFPNGLLATTINVSVTDGEYRRYSEVEFVVQPVNDPPSLFKPKIEPAEGDTKTEFSFSVKYSDMDGDNYPTIELVIDGNTYEMYTEDPSNNSVEGILYKYSLKLSKGTHNYYFQCDDNSGGPNSTYATDSASVKVTEKTSGAAADSAAVIGIVVAVIVIIIVVLVVLFIFLKKRKESEPAPPPSPPAFPPGERPPPLAPPPFGARAPDAIPPPEHQARRIEIEWDSER